jgi:hypothetical protein
MTLEDFIMTPTTQLQLTVTIPAWLRPYFTDCYNDHKKNGESEEDYILRIIGNEALSYRLGDLRTTGRTTKDSEYDTYDGTVTSDYTDEAAKL